MAFTGTGKIWMNGVLVDWADARIHLASHVIHYGSGVFEGARCYDTSAGPSIFRLGAHMRRLMDSARIYRMEPAYTQAQLEEAVTATIRANGMRACYIRPIIYRGYAALGINPLPCPVDCAVMVWEWGAYLGPEALERGVDVMVSSWSRVAPNTFPSLAKSSANYASAQLIKLEALQGGYAEGIALDTQGYVSEGSGQNVFVVRDGILRTPPMASAILPGITRDSIMTLAHEMGLTVREEMIPREMLYVADELFFVGTAAEVTPIRSVDRIVIGSGSRGPITAQLQDTYFRVVRGELSDTRGWLSPAYPDGSVPAAS